MPVPVAHACNPSYSEGKIRRIEVRSQPQANSSGDPILKTSFTEKGLMEELKV
jgi:hypothetical protein